MGNTNTINYDYLSEIEKERKINLEIENGSRIVSGFVYLSQSYPLTENRFSVIYMKVKAVGGSGLDHLIIPCNNLGKCKKDIEYILDTKYVRSKDWEKGSFVTTLDDIKGTIQTYFSTKDPELALKYNASTDNVNKISKNEELNSKIRL